MKWLLALTAAPKIATPSEPPGCRTVLRTPLAVVYAVTIHCNPERPPPRAP
jgi:hypothetical protein